MFEIDHPEMYSSGAGSQLLPSHEFDCWGLHFASLDGEATNYTPCQCRNYLKRGDRGSCHNRQPTVVNILSAY